MFAALLLGCDIVQGFQNAGDAIFPRTKAYLDAPGYRVSAGDYDYIDLLNADQVYIAARSAGAADRLTLMHYANPEPCSLSGVGTYWGYARPGAERLLLAYFDERAEGGTLHFADGACNTFELTIEDARLPLTIGFSGTFIVESGRDLLAVNPVRGEKNTIASDVTIVGSDTLLDIAFLSEGRLGIVSPDTGLSWFGQDVVSAVRLANIVLFEDQLGVHEIDTTRNETTSAPRVSLNGGACRLVRLPLPDLPGSYRETDWVAFNDPCESKRLIVRDPQADLERDLGERDFDPRYVKVVSTGPTAAGDDTPSLSDLLRVFYLSDVDPETAAGELHVLDPLSDRDFVVGRTSAFWHTELARRTFDGAPGYDHGFALLDVEDGVGRYVVWERDGTTRELARNVLAAELYAPWPAILADFDGDKGTLAQLAQGELHTIASGVPRFGAVVPDFQDLASGKALVMQDFDGNRGTLALAHPLSTSGGSGALDDFGLPLREAKPVARDVGRYLRNFLGTLPGYIYIRAFDPLRGTGRLEYQNTELVFTSVVAEGVSSMLDVGNKVLYTVPSGAGAGIWVTSKK